MKIIVIKRDKIGDMLLTTPMLRCLRRAFPSAEIHVLANDYNAWVLNGNPDVDRIWVYGRARQGGGIRVGALWGQIKMSLALRRARFDVAIVGNGSESPRAIERAFRIGARRTIGYCVRPDLCSRLTDALPPPHAAMHEAERLAALLNPLGVEVPGALPNPQYHINDGALRQAGEWLIANGMESVPFVVIGLGARREKKQPTAEQIVRWATSIKDNHGFDTVLTWTPGGGENALYPGDDQVAEKVLERSLGFIHPYRGVAVKDPALFGASLQCLLGLIWRGKGALFPDSGLMHFAAASPGGVVGLFADIETSASPAEWGPRGEKIGVVVADQSVSDLEDSAVLGAFSRLFEQS